MNRKIEADKIINERIANGVPRKEIIHELKVELKLTDVAASTYYQNNRLAAFEAAKANKNN